MDDLKLMRSFGWNVSHSVFHGTSSVQLPNRLFQLWEVVSSCQGGQPLSFFLGLPKNKYSLAQDLFRTSNNILELKFHLNGMNLHV